MKLDRAGVKVMRDVITNALEVVSKQHGVTFKVGAVKFEVDGSQARFTLIGESSDEGLGNRSRDNYLALCEHYGMKREWLDKPFRDRTKLMKVIGLDTGKHKNIVQLRDEVSGRTYVCSPDYVKARIDGKFQPPPRRRRPRYEETPPDLA